jgi:hypothetical protein
VLWYCPDVRLVLGWTVMAIVSLVVLAGAIIGSAELFPDDDQYIAVAAVFGVILGIAGGLWLKDRIVGVKK